MGFGLVERPPPPRRPSKPPTNPASLPRGPKTAACANGDFWEVGHAPRATLTVRRPAGVVLLATRAAEGERRGDVARLFSMLSLRYGIMQCQVQ